MHGKMLQWREGSVAALLHTTQSLFLGFPFWCSPLRAPATKVYTLRGTHTAYEINMDIFSNV